VLGSTTCLPWNHGTSYSRRGHGTTVVLQYHRYCGTTILYLPTNKSPFNEDLRAKINWFIDW